MTRDTFDTIKLYSVLLAVIFIVGVTLALLANTIFSAQPEPRIITDMGQVTTDDGTYYWLETTNEQGQSFHFTVDRTTYYTARVGDYYTYPEEP